MKAVIFDFNGTLFFDSEFHESAWRKTVMDIFGEEMVDEMKQKMHGTNNKDTLLSIKPEFSDEECTIYSLKKEERYRKQCLDNPDRLHLVPGATSLFTHLKEKNIPFTIASASIKENIDFFVEVFKLDTWFDVDMIVHDNGDYPSKREMFIEASKRLNVPLKECLIIEDSLVGITAAKEVQAGRIIGIGPKEKHAYLASLGAHACIEDYIDFIF